MPSHLHIGFEEMTRAMKGVRVMQNLASHYGIPNIFTDNGGKLLQILVATGLDYEPGRTGPDARDRFGNKYEIKSTDVSARVGFGTSHHPLFAEWEDRLFDVDHLNNPKIPLSLVREVGDIMYFKDVPAPWTPGSRRRSRPYKYEELVSMGLVKAA